MKHRKPALAGLLALVLALLCPAALAEMKIAVVDVERSIVESEEGLRAQAALKKMFDKRQQELDGKARDLKKEKEEIEKQAKVISRDALEKRVQEWEKKWQELQQTTMEYEKEFQKKRGDLMQPIFDRVMGLLGRVAQQDGYDVVVDKRFVPFSRRDLDLTDRVIQMYNASSAPAPAPSGTGSAKPPAPPASAAPAPKK